MHAKFFIFGAASSFSKQERAASEHHASQAEPKLFEKTWYKEETKSNA